MDLHPAVVARLERLAPDQRAAATAPPGPLLCVAPAGSGKTTTLVARVAWLVASGAARPDEIAAITFNTRAAEELRERLAAALEPLGIGDGAASVRVRTFHALGLEILRDAGSTVEPLGMLDDTETFATNFVITPWIGVIREPVVWRPDGAEIERVIEVPFAALTAPGGLRVEQWERDGVRRPVYFFDYRGDTIWGATARIVKHYLDLVANPS